MFVNVAVVAFTLSLPPPRRLCHTCVYLLVRFFSRITQKVAADLAEIFREGFTWPSLEVNRLWWLSGSESGCRMGFLDSSALLDKAVRQVSAPFLPEG